jgi:hypothetical protein
MTYGSGNSRTIAQIVAKRDENTGHEFVHDASRQLSGA